MFSEDINLLDANIGLLPFGRSQAELDWLAHLVELIPQQCNASGYTTLDAIARRIIQDETSLDLSRYDIYTTSTGARPAISNVLEHVVTSAKPVVMYASPNWIFEQIVGRVPDAVGVNFFASNADEFVRAFALADHRTTAALIIVDPANPLGYRFTSDHIAEIERVAEAHGIVPVFDDVFRGMQEKGSRHSSSGYSQRSVIVETTSKRFGARGLGATWTLVPKILDLQLYGSRLECQGCDVISGAVTQALYETGYGERVRSMIVDNTRAFIRGFNEINSSPGRFTVPFLGMPFFLLHLPSGVPATQFADYASKNGVQLTSAVEWTCSLQEKLAVAHQESSEALRELSHSDSILRICPTKIEPVQAYMAGYHIGKHIR